MDNHSVPSHQAILSIEWFSIPFLKIIIQKFIVSLARTLDQHKFFGFLSP
jgi:hypothetical protein